jgi:hypothetical protein
MEQEKILRDHLVSLLEGGDAHATFEAAVKDVPAAIRGIRPEGLPHSAWELLDHLRITLWDILEFSRDGKHVSPDWPKGYWPTSPAPPDDQAWDKAVAAFQADMKAMIKLITDPSTDLFARIPHGDGQTVLREAMLVADHNAYHIGQLILVRSQLGAWK